MGITCEMTRKQIFTGELEPREFVRIAVKPETINYLTIEEMRNIIETYQLECNKKESENGN